MNTDLIHLEEPRLTFRFEQPMQDPRDGLTLFGPLDQTSPLGIRCGVLGTKSGIELFRRWLASIQHPQWLPGAETARPPFPGFEAAFRTQLAKNPYFEIEIPEQDIHAAVRLDDRHQRVYQTVSLYADRLVEAVSKEEIAVDVWFIVIPDIVYANCRPRSQVELQEQIEALDKMVPRVAKGYRRQPSLFAADNLAAVPYHYDVDFRNQLKARLLSRRLVTQIVRERVLAGVDATWLTDLQRAALASASSAIAWNLSTALFYKAGGRPWKTHDVRDGVCYIGLAFKRDDTSATVGTACCAAQMFLDSGDGIVFKGALGPWYRKKEGEFHLSRPAARELIAVALDSYRGAWDHSPKELFIHGKVRFNNDEWFGFQDAAGEVQLVGVHIRPSGGLKLYRRSDYPVLRGLACKVTDRQAYLWTRGYVPRLRTYVGREVPNPLRVDISHGEAEMDVVLGDILALSKLNYNSCIFADGDPVTLKFADAVGEILTAGPSEDIPPLPFKHYI